MTSQIALGPRRALVTGASSGIGAAIARKLAFSGASVTLIGRRKAALDEVEKSINDGGGRTYTLVTDLSDPSARRLVAADCIRRGGIDLLVNNAGVMRLSPVRTASLDDWAAMIDANLTAAMDLTRLLLPAMVDAPQRPADIIMISSLSAHDPAASRSVYAATKAALNAFSESLRREVGNDGVRVTVIAPGLVSTDLRRDIDEQRIHELHAQQDPPQPLSAGDVAEVVAFAASRPAEVALNLITLRSTRQLN